MTSRNYCFTSFVPEETLNLRNSVLTKYICWGIETCPSSGRSHDQGYIELIEPVRITKLKALAPTVHFEKRIGTQKEAIKYCMKDGKFQEFGEKSIQGKRTDLEDLKKNLDENKDMKTISEENFSCFMKYQKGISQYKLLHCNQRNWETNLEIHVGEPGSGKSHQAFTRFPNAYWMMRPTGDKIWFDGYTGQDTIVLDDFYGWLPWDLLLRLADKYPLKLETKGGTVECVIKNLIITSNKPPTQWYKSLIKNKEDFLPLARRITLYKDDYKSGTFVDMAKAKALTDKLFQNDIINMM